MARFDKFDNGNPAESRLKAHSPNVGTSAFDFSCTKVGNTMLGLYAPIDCFDVVPSETVQLAASAVIEFRNPTKRQIMNGFRVYFHSRYQPRRHLWEGAQNQVDLGRSGSINLETPNLIYTSVVGDSNVLPHINVNALTPMSLLNFLGLPVSRLQTLYNEEPFPPLRSFRPALNSESGSTHFSFKSIAVNSRPTFFPAEVCFMYQRCWRDHHAPKNLLQNNKKWFPDNESHFILSYGATDCVAIDYENEDLHSYVSDTISKEAVQACNIIGSIDPTSVNVTAECNNPSSNSELFADSGFIFSPNLAGIKFVQFRGDRFNTGSPFPDLIRGDVPTLASADSYIPVTGSHHFSSHRIFDSVQQATNDHVYGHGEDSIDSAFRVQNPLATTTMSDLYTLETITAFKRKMGMTQGDYNEMVKAQYGTSPRAPTNEDTYIGGFYQDFSISPITQTSESGETPLGTKAGQGVSSGSGNLGSIKVPDFGWIMTFMFIVPDVYYTQGKPRQYSKKSQMEFYFPLFNNLPAQEIRNDEVYIRGNDSFNAQPFAYEPRFEEYKSRHNQVSGFMSLPHSVAAYDSARIMSRRFSGMPSFNNNFVMCIPENVDMEVFSVVDEPPFDFAVNLSVRRVSPMPYMAIEGSMSSPALNA